MSLARLEIHVQMKNDGSGAEKHDNRPRWFENLALIRAKYRFALDVGEMAMCLELVRVAGRGNFYGHLLRWICFVVVNVGWLRRQSRLVYAKYCMGVRTDTITNSVTPVMEKTSKTKNK